MEAAQERNPRGAGRKPIDAIRTTTKATVPVEYAEEWEALENKTAFVREAIAAAFEARKAGDQ